MSRSHLSPIEGGNQSPLWDPEVQDAVFGLHAKWARKFAADESGGLALTAVVAPLADALTDHTDEQRRFAQLEAGLPLPLVLMHNPDLLGPRVMMDGSKDETSAGPARLANTVWQQRWKKLKKRPLGSYVYTESMYVDRENFANIHGVWAPVSTFRFRATPVLEAIRRAMPGEIVVTGQKPMDAFESLYGATALRRLIPDNPLDQINSTLAA